MYSRVYLYGIESLTDISFLKYNLCTSEIFLTSLFTICRSIGNLLRYDEVISQFHLAQSEKDVKRCHRVCCVNLYMFKFYMLKSSPNERSTGNLVMNILRLPIRVRHQAIYLGCRKIVSFGYDFIDSGRLRAQFVPVRVDRNLRKSIPTDVNGSFCLINFRFSFYV